jgi:hypothetical protein
MVREAIADKGGERFGAVVRVAKQLGIGYATSPSWSRRTVNRGAQRDSEGRLGFLRAGARPATTEIAR